MRRSLIASLVVALSFTFASDVRTQSRPGMVHGCTRYGPAGWFDSTAPELVGGHVTPCTENDSEPVPNPTPAPTPEYPPEIQGYLEVGKYYKSPYSAVYKVIGIVSPIKNPEPTWLLQQVTPQGGICGYLNYIPMSHSHSANVLYEVPPLEPPLGCPIAGDIQR